MVVYTCKKCKFEFTDFEASNEYCCPRCETEQKELKRDFNLMNDVVSSYIRKPKNQPKFKEQYYD